MYRLLRPLLFRLDPERSHRLALRAARVAEAVAPLVAPGLAIDDAALRQDLLGRTFRNPVGLAAGFDKNAERIRAWHALGFGFCEVGSVTARSAPGNPRPRAFRLREDRALINRMGLPNDGAETIARRLADAKREPARLPIGVNIAKTHDAALLGEAALDDFAASVARLAPFADYLALNVSCPNTADGKTFEEPDALDALLARVMPVARAHGDPPVLIKLSPPPVGPGGSMRFEMLDELVAAAETHGIAGFVATNTASDRVNLATDPSVLAAIGRGGLSGRPLAERALATVRRLYERTGGRRVIIGVGGIDSADAAYACIRAGASLVQVYTGLVYEGPALVRRINRGLRRRLATDGLEHLSRAVGANHRQA